MEWTPTDGASGGRAPQQPSLRRILLVWSAACAAAFAMLVTSDALREGDVVWPVLGTAACTYPWTVIKHRRAAFIIALIALGLLVFIEYSARRALDGVVHHPHDVAAWVMLLGLHVVAFEAAVSVLAMNCVQPCQRGRLRLLAVATWCYAVAIPLSLDLAVEWLCTRTNYNVCLGGIVQQYAFGFVGLVLSSLLARSRGWLCAGT